MLITQSKDGTDIAYEKTGSGPALIIVVGAFNDRGTGRPLADELETRFTVYTYDRRGRGDSGDTLPYAIEREIEDIDALIAQAGGSAFVFGYSSGAALSMLAAAQGSAIRKLAVYDVPLFSSKPAGAAEPIRNRAGLADELTNLVAVGRRGDAVELFQIKAVGIPREIVAQLRHAPFRPALEKMAHTLEYEMRILESVKAPETLSAGIAVPVLFMAGSESPAFLRDTADVLAAAAAQGTACVLAGQTHDLEPKALGPALREFFI